MFFYDVYVDITSINLSKLLVFRQYLNDLIISCMFGIHKIQILTFNFCITFILCKHIEWFLYKRLRSFQYVDAHYILSKKKFKSKLK